MDTKKNLCFMVMLIIAAFQPVISQGRITITSYPRPLFVQLGATFTLSCEYNSYTFHSWVHPTEGEFTRSQGRLQFNNFPDIHIATLQVDSATIEDEGVYMCRAVTDNNVVFNETITALLFERVQVTTESMLSYQARLCEPVVLNCTALHHDSITWRGQARHDLIPREIRNSSDGCITVLSETGQLVIREVKLSDNGTYFCAVSNRVSSKEIIAYLSIDLHPPPENITVSISSTGLTGSLTFTWNPVATDTSCLKQYQIHATNCGTCSTDITNLTTVTCEVADHDLTPDEMLCTIVVYVVVDGENASEASMPFTVMLRDIPLVKCIPHYSYPEGNLTTIHCKVSASPFANETGDIDLSTTSYTINYYDATNSTLCASTTIPASLCEKECIYVFNVSLSSCAPTANIDITAYASNILGRGPQSESIIIESTNDYLNVDIYSSNFTVYILIPLQSQTVNTTYSILYRLGETLDDCEGSQNILHEKNTSTPLQDFTMFLLQLPTPSQANFVVCFVLTVNFPDFTLVVEGNFDINGADTVSDVMLSTAAVSTVTPKHTSIDTEDNKTIIVTTLCVVFITLITLVIISLIILILKRRRKWRSVRLSNQAENIYELDDAPRISSTQVNCPPQHSNNNVRDDSGTLIYADVITSSGFSNNQFSLFMDDDRVEYAEIERKTNGHPTTAPPTKILPARNIKRQSTKGDHGYPLNLDNLLIQLQSQVTPKWYQFGLVIGIDMKILDSYTSYSPEVCIIEILDHWLRNHHTKPTWREVAQALKEIEIHELGEKILKEYVDTRHDERAY